MGYLFDLDRGLARLFLRGAMNKNCYLGDVGYIRDLLAETDDT